MQKSMHYVFTILSCCDDILGSPNPQQARLCMMVQKLKSVTLPIPDEVELTGNMAVLAIKMAVRKLTRWFLSPLYIHQRETQSILIACLEEIECELYFTER